MQERQSRSCQGTKTHRELSRTSDGDDADAREVVNRMERNKPQLAWTARMKSQLMRAEGRVERRLDLPTERRLELDLFRRDGLELDLSLQPRPIGR